MSGVIYPPPRRIEKRRLWPRQAVSGASSAVQPTTTSAQQTTPASTTSAAASSSSAASQSSSEAAASSSSTEAAESSSSQAAETSRESSSSAAATTTSQSSSAAQTTAAPTTTSSSAAASPTSQSITVSVVEVTVPGSGGSVAVSSATTSIVIQPSASSDSSSRSSSGLSSGARAGVIAGSVVGGVALLALILAACLLIRRKRKNQLNDKDQIRWPELAATAEDRAALYPETTHRTGRAGVGEDGDMEEVSAYSAGAGVAGVGAGALAGRYPSQSSEGRQPTLPQVAPSIYDSEHGYGQGAIYPPSQSHYTNSNQGHGATPNYLGAGPASIDYYARQNQTPSPPRQFGDDSSTGHDGPGVAGVGAGAGAAAMSNGGHTQGSDPYAHEEAPQDGRSSPQPMQVGGAFGSGYDESDGGKRWRLSVVNDDAHRD